MQSEVQLPVSIMEFGPQPGPQEKFLETEADIAIYGGGAGGGKTFGLLLEALRNLDTPGFDAVIFRRERPQITNPGGIWDESQKIFPFLGCHSREGAHLDWYKNNGLSLKMAHMQRESDKYDWMGAQIAYAGFDELTHFTRSQVFYIISRLRSTTGVRGYLRGTCNPDADSWVAEFIGWWIDQDTGFPIPERDGELRWFIRDGDNIIWASSKDELADEYGEEKADHALSVTFIRSTVHDNKILLAKDPTYLARLNALDRVDRARLLDGNWKIRAAAGEVFKRSDFELIDVMPTNIIKRIRYWDRASTRPHESNKNPDWTVGTAMALTMDNQIIIEHVERFRDSPLGVEKKIRNIASQDGGQRTIGIEKDPGSAGQAEADYYVRALLGYDVRVFPVFKDKVMRAKGYSAQVEAGNVKLLKGDWNDAFLNEHDNFPPEEGKEGKDDQVDSASGAFNFLVGDKVGSWVAPSKQVNKPIASGYSRKRLEW